MDKYKNKYRIQSARAQWWDYGWNGAYFITICTKNREHYFGEIRNGSMRLSRLGVIADILWYEIPNHSPHVKLGEFVVMPNHIHGILILDKPRDIETGGGDPTGGGGSTIVESGHALTLPVVPADPSEPTETTEPKPTAPIPPITDKQNPKTIGQKRFQNIGKNTISSIIGSYKSAVTKHANRLGLPNGWQTKFHDHIIRNKTAFRNISNYIIDNPKNWKEDRFNG